MSGEANQIYKEINYRFKHVIYRNYRSIRFTSQYPFFTIIKSIFAIHLNNRKTPLESSSKTLCHVKYMTQIKTENICIGINKHFLKLSH